MSTVFFMLAWFMVGLSVPLAVRSPTAWDQCAAAFAAGAPLLAVAFLLRWVGW